MLKIDLHIHTIHSGHAYGTFYDVVNEAKKKKMQMIAITDHGPSMPGVTGSIHFLTGHRVPAYKDLKILWGCEANIVDGDGNIDLDEFTQNKVDIILAAVHLSSPYKNLGKEKNTQAIMNALKNPHIKILAHPTHQQCEYDLDKICLAAIKNNVLLELDLAYIKDYGEKDLEKFRRLVQIVRENKAKLIVDSDAHFLHEIGDDSVLKTYSQKIGLTPDLIINNYPEELMKILQKDKGLKG